MAVDMSKFLGRFIEESRERLGLLVAGIPTLDEKGRSTADLAESIDAMFRAAHTIKGSAKMLGQGGIGEMAHGLENILDALRSGRLSASSDSVRALYKGADALSALIERLASGQSKPEADKAILEELAGVGGSGEAKVEAGREAKGLPIPAPTHQAVSAPQSTREAAAPAEAGQTVGESVRVRIEKLDELVRLTGESLVARVRSLGRVDELAAIERLAFSAESGDTERLRVIRERIGHLRRKLRAEALERESLDAELHAAALAMRMLPLSIVFEPAVRMAREIALSLDKEIDCLVAGGEIELDRQIIDRLGEVIIHLLRNAIDHGVEPPAVRTAAGKPPRGKICLSARQAEGSVIVEVSDDGSGLDVEAIREKALRARIIAPDKAASLSAREIADIIFLPGFSTSPLVTDLSGRGVGLDIVRKTVVEALKGSITVDSTPGSGLRFALRLPPTLAIMRVLFASAGETIFGFASHDVSGVIDIEDANLMDIAGGRAAIIRNEFVPIRSLAEILGTPDASARATTRVRGGEAGKTLRLLVVHDGSERLALEIDALIDERESVVKPLPRHMRGISLVSGILTNDSNYLICLLNAPALVEMTRKGRGSSPTAHQAPPDPEGFAEILIVDDSLNTREIERDVLEAHGYRITLAEDGLDGLAKARRKKYDAVLTDVEMPGLDGFALTERLRAEEGYRDAPIVILTSRSRDEDRKRGMRAGADAYIVKGDFEQGSLLETLKALGL